MSIDAVLHASCTVMLRQGNLQTIMFNDVVLNATVTVRTQRKLRYATILYNHTTINAVVQPFYSEHLKCTNPYVHSCDARRNFYIKIHGRLTSTNNYVHSRYAKRNYASQFIANTWDVQTFMCIHATLNATCTANVMCELDIYKPVCSFMIR